MVYITKIVDFSFFVHIILQKLLFYMYFNQIFLIITVEELNFIDNTDYSERKTGYLGKKDTPFFCYFVFFRSLRLFNTARIVTPTSPKTAIHMFEMPRALRRRIVPLIPKAP